MPAEQIKLNWRWRERERKEKKIKEGKDRAKWHAARSKWGPIKPCTATGSLRFATLKSAGSDCCELLWRTAEEDEQEEVAQDVFCQRDQCGCCCISAPLQTLYQMDMFQARLGPVSLSSNTTKTHTCLNWLSFNFSAFASCGFVVCCVFSVSALFFVVLTSCLFFWRAVVHKYLPFWSGIAFPIMILFPPLSFLDNPCGLHLVLVYLPCPVH